MLWFMAIQTLSTRVELVKLGRQSESDKNLEFSLLHRQLAIYKRRQDRSPLLAGIRRQPTERLAGTIQSATLNCVKSICHISLTRFVGFLNLSAALTKSKAGLVTRS